MLYLHIKPSIFVYAKIFVGNAFHFQIQYSNLTVHCAYSSQSLNLKVNKILLNQSQHSQFTLYAYIQLFSE